ncbi:MULTISPECIES: acyl-CoA dehydrogenase family protein [unclassified Frankia]|uniref:acyl-CoA dehydrogenase family protein n=1 Tax=unclassified Frankia TaxID=2632575 RepID=UPI002AD39094|nr:MULTISPECIES: acyl-CoA dehydrogenase family protein [unclassified Frankia]
MSSFRGRARQWLAVEAPRRGWIPSEAVAADELARSRDCQQALCAAGFGAITYPAEYGGAGLGVREQIEFNEEATAYSLPLSELVVGLGVCAPTLLALGTDRQKARYLPPLLRADEIWCQLFSEPGAGSDLASLSTRAAGSAASGWTVNGQKVWTSGAQHADFGLLLARTDPQAASKHAGLTMFLLDMAAPGITVRPLRQIDGTAHFNEVFFDDVHVPPQNLVGTVNRGWAAALVSLMSERVSLGTTRATAGLVPDAETLIAAARRRGVATDPVLRAELVDIVIRERVLAYVGKRINAAVLAGREPGPEGSIAKLLDSDLLRRAATVGARIHGPATTAWDPANAGDSTWSRAVLFAPGMRIAGGTDEIQKNTLAERTLGLPR